MMLWALIWKLVWHLLLLTPLVLVVVIVGAVAWAAGRLSPDQEDDDSTFVLDWTWLTRGYVVPVLIWFLMNVGISFHLQPFMPEIQAAKYSGGNWITPLLWVTVKGAILICTFWGAVTLTWLLLRKHSGLAKDAQWDLRVVSFTAIAIMLLPACFLIFLWDWWAIGLIVMLIGLPIVAYSRSEIRQKKKSPSYARAIARMKFGKFAQAEQEILAQLEEVENDFDGWMMLAELQATRFKEISEAEKIVLDVCLQPDATPSQISVALHKLADWQLQVAGDSEGAARSLRLIVDQLPGTHLAHMAELRIAQLPRTNADLREQQTPHPVKLPPTESDTLQRFHADPTSSGSKEATIRINQLFESLSRNPGNISDRESYARLLAEPIGEVSLAIEQIELLLGVSHQPDVKRAEWLTLIAGWQLQLLNDNEAAAKTLARIISESPGTPQAFAAQRRLNLMKA